MLAGLDLITLSLILFGLLIVLLAFGVWIGIALLVVGIAAMTATNAPIGTVMATTV